MNNIERIDELVANRNLPDEDLKCLLTTLDEKEEKYLYEKASEVAKSVYGNKVFLRGLIEFSNYCKNDRIYCGIRRSNCNAERYRLSKDEILTCADAGYELGFRTIVLQSGEDMSYSDDDICEIVKAIKKQHEDVAVTLSIGEKSYESYKKYFDLVFLISLVVHSGDCAA